MGQACGRAAGVTGARHVAIIAAPLPGHLNPLQALGAELVARGWQVTIVHVAGAARFVTDDAIGFAALPDACDGDALDGYLARLANPTGRAGLTGMIRATAAMTQALLHGGPAVLDRIGATAVIADAVEPAGPLIARHLGVPHVVGVTGLPLMRGRDVPPPYLGWSYRPDVLGRLRNRAGYAVADRLLHPIARVLRRYRDRWGLDGDSEGHGARLHVAQCPRELDYPRADLPPGFLYGSPWRRGSGAGVEIPDDGRPLVFCSLGTLQGSRRALFTTMAQACMAVGARAVIGHGGGLTPAQEALLPGRPLVRAFWPQEAVLRRCAAAILHGGFNSVLDALAAGVPIVALPIAFEQPATAARVARIGAGRVLPWRRLGVPALTRALDEVIARPAYRSAARRLAVAMAGGGGAPGAAAAINAALGAPS